MLQQPQSTHPRHDSTSLYNSQTTHSRHPTAIDYTHYLNRGKEVQQIEEALQKCDQEKNNCLVKKGIYIYGDSGVGKTSFAVDVLTKLGYDVIKYDAGDIRNKQVIDNITKHNMSNKNVMSLFNKKNKKIAIIMDEIDGMNNGDKGGINTLIKLIRPKKTKKQQTEEITTVPIICIGNYHMDKKIKELMKVCTVVELKRPTTGEITALLNAILPESTGLVENAVQYAQGDIRKLKHIVSIYKTNSEALRTDMFDSVFQRMTNNDDAKKITQKLIHNKYEIEEHLNVMNETDRTIVGLLWHENIVDYLGKMQKKDSLPFYLNALENMCLADYIDRITFQKQIWQFNELSSLIKTFKNNKLFHDCFPHGPAQAQGPALGNSSDLRFTKVLTKYSTEYNNTIFIQSLCSLLGMDKKDVLGFFLHLKITHEDDETQILKLLEPFGVTKLDVNRIYRYLDKYSKDVEFEDDQIVDEIMVEEEMVL
jgi:DNA polymerase III delta prime subunit